MPGVPVRLALTGVLLWTAMAVGCASTQAYRYENIKASYADLACNLKPSQSAGAPATCAINSQLSLAEVLDIARANNPDLLMAAARIERARALLKKATAPFYPQVSLTTEYMQGDAPSAFLFKTIDQRKLPDNTDFNHPGWFENYESGIGAGINLFNGGRDALQREMAKAGLTISERDRDSIENQVMATAIGIYYDVLAAGRFVGVAQESVETNRSQLAVMEVRYRAGSALKTDLLSLRVRMAESKERLLQSLNRERLAKAALAEILGVEPNVPFGLDEGQPYAIDIPDDQLTALDRAIAQRPELASVRERLRQSKMAVDAATAGYLPQLDFKTRYYVDDPSMHYNAERDNWTAGLYLNWNIFDGFATTSSRTEALAGLKEAMSADRKTTLAVKFDVKKAYLNLDEAEQRLDVATSSVETARETLRLVKQQYDGGSANITRYLEAELAYNQARIHETSAYFDREKARAQIARAIGYWTGPRETAVVTE